MPSQQKRTNQQQESGSIEVAPVMPLDTETIKRISDAQSIEIEGGQIATPIAKVVQASPVISEVERSQALENATLASAADFDIEDVDAEACWEKISDFCQKTYGALLEKGTEALALTLIAGSIYAINPTTVEGHELQASVTPDTVAEMVVEGEGEVADGPYILIDGETEPRSLEASEDDQTLDTKPEHAPQAPQNSSQLGTALGEILAGAKMLKQNVLTEQGARAELTIDAERAYVASFLQSLQEQEILSNPDFQSLLENTEIEVDSALPDDRVQIIVTGRRQQVGSGEEELFRLSVENFGAIEDNPALQKIIETTPELQELMTSIEEERDGNATKRTVFFTLLGAGLLGFATLVRP